VNVSDFKPGDRVQLTGRFLRNTGQFTSDEAHKVWRVVGVKTYSKELTLVTVDEPSISATYGITAQELKEDPTLTHRRINAANLKHAHKPSVRDD
jgi:hypothetical protein